MSMTVKQHVDHWVSSSKESRKDMEASIKSKRRTLALFSGHQAIEKVLKALLAAQNLQITHTHKLTSLAFLCGLRLDNSQQAELIEITGFYISTKYSSVKSQFHQLCTPHYTDVWAKIIRKWHSHLLYQVAQARAKVKNGTLAVYPEKTFI